MLNPYVFAKPVVFTAVSTNGVIAIPAEAQPGDIAIISNFADNTGTTTAPSGTPAGWTQRATDSDTASSPAHGFRQSVFDKVLGVGDAGSDVSVLTGNGGQWAIMFVIHVPGVKTFTATGTIDANNSNPGSQTNLAGGATPHVFVFATAACSGTTGTAFVTETPAFANHVSTDANNQMVGGWTLYLRGGDAPADFTVDSDDHGTNGLAAFRYELSPNTGMA